MASGTINKYMDGTDSGWKPLTGENLNGTLYYRRIGNIFQIKNTSWIRLNEELGSGAYRILATIPAADRPGGVMFGMAYKNASPYPILAVKVESGNITLYNSSTSTITASQNLLLNVIVLV